MADRTDDAAWFAGQLSDVSARGIANQTATLIRRGVLPAGAKLPTVRDLAYRLGISPATVSEAWSELRHQRMIEGRGRSGSWVTGDTIGPRPARTGTSGLFGDDVLDLSLSVPDTAVLPPLDKALRHAAGARNLHSYERTPILDSLRLAVEQRWPYEPETFLATNGGYNAFYSAVHALIMPGATVAIEDPTAMRLLDILEDRGARPLPVACDAEGPLPEALAQALAHKPTAFVYQPRTHSVTGRRVSPARLDALAAVLAESDTLIIEDDGIGEVSPLPPASLGSRFPDRVIHILSFSKSHGPDLRLAVLSAPAAIRRQIQSYRSFSSGWTSRLLQEMTAWLLTDDDTRARLAANRHLYAERRAALVTALGMQGIAIPPGDGLCIWVPVASEQFALVTLAARRIAVLPGSKCAVMPTRHIRVATAILADNYEHVARSIRLAANGEG